MSFLDYFRCCCCKKKPIPASAPTVAPTRINHPTMVSYDFERATGMKRAFDALPEEKSIPPRNVKLAS